jgi:hypothetical protein
METVDKVTPWLALKLKQIIADHIEESVQEELFKKWESEMEGDINE